MISRNTSCVWYREDFLVILKRSHQNYSKTMKKCLHVTIERGSWTNIRDLSSHSLVSKGLRHVSRHLNACHNSLVTLSMLTLSTLVTQFITNSHNHITAIEVVIIAKLNSQKNENFLKRRIFQRKVKSRLEIHHKRILKA